MSSRKYQSAVLLGKEAPPSLENLLKEKTPRRSADLSIDSRPARKQRQRQKLSTPNKRQDGAKKLENKTTHFEKPSTPAAVDGGGDRNDRLDAIIQDLIQQQEQKKVPLKIAASLHNMKVHYSSVLNSNSLDEVKELLTDVIQENFVLKQELLQKDAKFLELQLDQVNSNLRKRRPCQRNGIGGSSKYELCQVLEEATAVEKDLKVRLAKTEIDLIEKTNILREVGSRMATLEEKCDQLEAENSFLRKTHQSCMRSLVAKNKVLEQRCEKTDARRKLDRAGLSEEIRECRWLLKNLARNVDKCVKITNQPKIEAIKQNAQSKRADGHLFGKEPCSKADRFRDWFVSTDQKVTQKAMAVWSEYLEREVDHLEEKVGQTGQSEGEDSLELLYKKQKNRKGQEESSLMSSTLEVDSDFGGVRPSPTFFRICRNAGLNSRVIMTSDEEEVGED